MQTTVPNLVMTVPASQSTYDKVMRLFELHGITIEETLSYQRQRNLPLASDQYYSDSFFYMGVLGGRTYVTNKIENFGDSVVVLTGAAKLEDTLKRYYPIEVEPQPEPEASDVARNKVLVTQSPFKFEYAVHDLAPFCLNDLRSQLGAYIGEQRRMSSASSAYLYLTVTPDGEMRFTNHAEGQLYLQDTGEFTRDVKRMLAGKKPTVIPRVTKFHDQVYTTIRTLNDGYYIGELENDDVVYKDISVAEAIEYALKADRDRRFDTLRVDRGDGQWKQCHDLQQLFKEATSTKYQKAEKKVIRRVMHISGGMSCKIGRTNWDKFKDSTLRVSKSKQIREGEERYWSTPGGCFIPDKRGVELTGLYLFVKQS